MDVSGWIGSFNFFYGPSADEVALLSGDEGARAAVVENRYSTMSDWFFQMVFVATTASIISGTLAERVRLWSFFLFTVLLTGFIYPLVGAWTWGGGWLSEMGFQDFAGSTIVHSTGGWAALAGGGDLLVQLIGVLAVGAFVFGVSLAVWLAIEKTIGVRVSRSVEELGQDSAELGIEAYPEFVLMPDPDIAAELRREG